MKSSILFDLLEKRTQKTWKRFSKYYENDTKPFINKISRDYKGKVVIPIHLLKQIKDIDKSKYFAAVCILRGGLPYSELFKADSWKIYYILCGRKNEKNFTQRFSRSVDKNLSQIANKKLLIIENNSPTGNTCSRVVRELKKAYDIKKSDLFLDYYFLDKKKPSWLKKAFFENKKNLSNFGEVYVASNKKVSKKEGEILIKEFSEKLK